MASSSPLRKYTAYLVIAGMALLIISAVVFLTEYSELKAGKVGIIYVNPHFVFLLSFMVGVQWLVFAFTQKFAEQRPQTLLRQYQTAKFAKLLLYLIVLVVYFFVANDKKYIMSFLINFIVYYVVFTGLEVWFLQRWMKTLPTSKKEDVGGV